MAVNPNKTPTKKVTENSITKTKTNETKTVNVLKEAVETEIIKEDSINSDSKLINNTPLVASGFIKEKIPLDTMIPCINATRGKLIYLSQRMSGYQEEWEKHGDIAYIELIELQSMARTDRAFFTENWLQIDDVRVLKFLNVDKFYTNFLDINNFDTLFEMDLEEMVKKVTAMSKGMRNSVGLRAVELIEAGVLDSIKTITALEKALDCELIIK